MPRFTIPRVAPLYAVAPAAWLRRLLGRGCRCGHPRQAHEHYRPGTDCGLCGCRRWRRGGAA